MYGTNRYSNPGPNIDETHFLSFSAFENLNGGALTDIFRLTGSPQTVNLNGNDGDDQFIVVGDGGVNGTITGGTGFDTFDQSGKKGAAGTNILTVNVSSLNGIENLIGSTVS